MRDAEELVEELNAIDQDCGHSGSADILTELRERWDRAAADLEGQSEEEVDDDTRLLLRRRLAEVGIELLALMFARGDAMDALPFASTLAPLAPTRDLKEEIHGASNDQANFKLLCRARRELHDRPRESRAALKKVIKESQEGGLTNAARAALDLPKPVTSAPTLFTFNSVGLSLFGDRDRIGSTVVKTHAICVLFLPVFPIAAYRVEDAGGDGYYFISKNKLSRLAKFCQAAVLAGIVLLAGTLSIQAYLGSESRQARLAMEDAQALVDKGETQAAISAYEDLVDRFGTSGASATMAKTGSALVSLYVAQVASPLTIEREGEAHAMISRFQALPKYVRSADASKTLSAQIVTWATALDGDSIKHQLASLRMLKEAEAIAKGDFEIAILRETKELSLAAVITKERPVDGLAVYMAIGAAGLPAAGEILRILNPSQLQSVERLSKQWLAAGEGDLEIAARMAAASTAVASAEQQALLEEADEQKLREAIARSATNQHLHVALANIMLADGRSQEALALLQSIGRPGELVLPAQLSLAHAHTELGNLEDADAVLSAYLSVRLGHFQNIGKEYDRAANALQDSLYEKANKGRLPPDIDSRLMTISDEDERLRVFEEWAYEVIQQDPVVSQLREGYDEYSDIVSAVLQQGMVKLQLANMSTGARREEILADAERSFLAIAADAKGLPGYHLNLGQVFHRLGKTKEGDAELDELLRQKEAGVMLDVAYVYRELRLIPQARAIAEEVWSQKQEPHDSNAAVLLSMLSTDLEGEEEWLRKASQEDPAIQVRLTSVKASRAQLEGRDQEADKFFAQVAAFHANIAAPNSASLNNGAIANQHRYEVTGKQEHLDSALEDLAHAYELTPQSAIVASNVASLQNLHGNLGVLSEWFKINEVRPTSTGAQLLVSHMALGANRGKLLAKLQKNVTLGKSRIVGKQVQLLAPNSFDAWETELDWYTMTRDSAQLAALLKRVQATNFDNSELEKNRTAYQAGESDEDILSFAKAEIVRTERLLEKARERGHGPTIAALALLLSANYTLLQNLELDIGAASKAVSLLKEATSTWPELATQYDLVASLFQLSLLKAVQGDEALTAYYSQGSRIYGTRPILLRGPEFEAIKPSLMSKLRAQPEFNQATALAIQLGSREPSMSFWLLGELAENSELMQLNAEALTRTSDLLASTIRVTMDPNSRAKARLHKLLQAHAK